MKKIIYVCDKCKREFKRTEIVQYVSQIVDCGESAKKETLELCKECNDGLKSMLDAYLSGNVYQIVEQPKTDEKPAEQPKVEENSTVKQDSEGDKPKLLRAPKDGPEPKLLKEEPKKSGALTPAETNIMLRMHEEGKNPEEIAAKLGRTPRGISRAITCAMNRKKREQDVLNENKENKEIKEESGLSAEGKKRDIPGILALARGGWTPRQIAGEHHCEVDEITEILATYRKK